MACTWKETQASRFADGALGRDEAAEYERHLDGCETCRARVAEQRRVDACLRESIVPVAPPATLLGSVAQAVALERETRRGRFDWLAVLRRRRLAAALVSLALAVALVVAAAGPKEVVALMQRALYAVPGIGVRVVDEGSLVAARPVVVRDGGVTLSVISLVSDGKSTTLRYSASGLPGGKPDSAAVGAAQPGRPYLRDASGVEYPATGAYHGVGGSVTENHVSGGADFGPLPASLDGVDLVLPRDYLLLGATWPEGTPAEFVAHIPLARPSESGLERAVPQSASATVDGVTLRVVASSAGPDQTVVLVEGEAPGEARVVGTAPNGPADNLTLRDNVGRDYKLEPEQSTLMRGESELSQSLGFEPLAPGASTLALTAKALQVVVPGTADLGVSLAGHEPGETFEIGQTVRLGGYGVLVKSGRIERDSAGDLWLYLALDLGPTLDGVTASTLMVDEPRGSLVMSMGAKEGAQLDELGIAIEPGEQRIDLVLSDLQVKVEGPWVLTFPVGGQPTE